MVNKYYDYTLAIITFFMPLSMAIPNILLIVAVILLLMHKKIERKDMIIGASVFVGYIIIKAIVNNNLVDNLEEYKNYFLFLLLIVLFSAKNNNKLISLAFVGGTITTVLISFIKIMGFYIENSYIPLGNTKEVSDLLLVHRPFLGIMCFISIVTLSNSFQLITNFIIIALTLFLFLIVARLAIFLLLTFGIYKLFRNITFVKKYFFIVAVLIITTPFFIVNKNIKDRFYVDDNFNKSVAKIKDYEPRFVIWNCLFDNQFFNSNNLFFGYNNIKEIQKRLNLCYKETIKKETKKQYYLQTQFNTHNQYLYFFYSGGIILLSIFFILVFYSLKNSILWENKFIVLSLLIFLLVENLFERQYGVYLLGIYIPLKQLKYD